MLPLSVRLAQSLLAASTCARSLHAEFCAIASNSFDRVRLDFSPLSRLPIASLSPRGSRPKYRPLTCFRFAPSCEVDGISQVWMLPLSHSGRVRAPWSPTTCTRLLSVSSGSVTIFRSLRCIPSTALTLAGPVDLSRPFTRFLFASPCEASGISQVWMLPLIHYGRIRAPWSPTTCTRLLHPSSFTRYRGRLLTSWVRREFPPLSRLVHPVAFNLTVSHPTIEASRHCFRSLRVGVARPRPRYARYPSSFRWKSTSWPPPSCARFLPADTHLGLPSEPFA